MAMGLEYYPPSAKEVPKGLTSPSVLYRVYSVAVLVSLLVFLLFYLALVVGAGYLVYYSAMYPMEVVNRFTVVAKLGAVAISGMLFLFLLKGLFKKHDVDETDYTEITEAEQPELYAFIRRLCREVHAPFPYRIYLSADVNAAVFFDSSLLNLILPVRKNLLIGLGLVNVATLSEFKATLAHEFGHFAQTGMAIGNYVHIANRVIGDLVFGRDRWDEMLEDGREADIRVAIFAWVLTGIVWVLRQLLAGVFMLINLVRLALMRQMEFHADQIAVSVSGSDALVHLLAKLPFANESLGQAAADLRMAANNGRFSRDLYVHQLRAAEKLRQERKDPTLGLAPSLPAEGGAAIQVIPPTNARPSSLWDSHPATFEREQNVKRRYVAAPLDDRSAWLLFRDPESLRTTLTVEFYQDVLWLPDNVVLADPVEVQSLIDGNRQAVTELDKRYGGLYDDRPLEPGDIDAVAQSVITQPLDARRLAHTYERVYAGKLKEWLEQHRKRKEERDFLYGLRPQGGKARVKDFEYRGSRRQVKEVEGLLRAVITELEQDQEFLAAFDRDVLATHYQMARQLGAALDTELLDRYRFHVALQDLIKRTAEQLVRMHGIYQFLSSRTRVSEDEVRQVVTAMREARAALQLVIDGASALKPPSIETLDPYLPLHQYVRPAMLVSEHYSDTQMPSGDWFKDLARQLGQTRDRLAQVHGTSQAGILSLQEQIAGSWRAAAAGRAVAHGPAHQ